MAKYSFEFKKKVVKEYLDGKGSYERLANHYQIKYSSNIKKWVSAFRRFGDEGLIRSKKNKSYSFSYKLYMVELYLNTDMSYQNLALLEGINNPVLICRWVNDFRIAGPDALRPKKKGRSKLMKSSQKSTDKNEVNITAIDTSGERVKQLEDELLKLKIENAYLKEFRRLRLEEETLLKK
ncbi:transposase [Clostridium thermobutyricum DSM 4928]|uniref:Transposase n=1 Tax=Clostridium thermobutyricum DSM 4928 TaxID=1121339 RepID=A0A1V4SVC8_9CLOT|nr:transposase [Clostridium thermobutyricum DSM 4928]